jgi:hypothetical protein
LNVDVRGDASHTDAPSPSGSYSPSTLLVSLLIPYR